MNYTEFSKRFNPEKYKDVEYVIPSEACDSLFNTHKITSDDSYRIAGNINCVGNDMILQQHVKNFDGDSIARYIAQFKFPERISKLHIFTIESAYVAAKSASKHKQMFKTVVNTFLLDMKILAHMKYLNKKPVPKNNYNKGVTLKKVS